MTFVSSAKTYTTFFVALANTFLLVRFVGSIASSRPQQTTTPGIESRIASFMARIRSMAVRMKRFEVVRLSPRRDLGCSCPDGEISLYTLGFFLRRENGASRAL